VPFIGEYGTTYTINLYIFGVIIGTLIMGVAPWVSKLITNVRHRQIPFQGITVALTLLVVASVLVQLLS
jgi:hypothetical protein